MCSDKTSKEARRDIYAWLMARRHGQGNADLLAKIYASWSVGEGVLPDWLGMEPDSFMAMMAHHFPGYRLESVPNPGRVLDLSRAPESEDLRRLLAEGCSAVSPYEQWMMQIVVAGCMGSDHLWQDLGLWSRKDLSRLMLLNFEPLARRNSKDMKWKKFLYKQLCATEGIYICRAPSCEVCADYADCYGSES